jgi:hypothetical protein
LRRWSAAGDRVDGSLKGGFEGESEESGIKSDSSAAVFGRANSALAPECAYVNLILLAVGFVVYANAPL